MPLSYTPVAQQETEVLVLPTLLSPSVIASRNSRLDQELPPTPKSFRRGWRFAVSAGLGVGIFTLCCNIVLLLLSYFNGGLLIKTTDCSATKVANTWSHLGINALSTLLLGASNYALQVLLSPTRREIDARHAQYRSVEIGSPALSNWCFMTYKRRLLYVILFVSSIPLHLLYNSAIITINSSILPRIMTVSSDFLEHNPLVSPYNQNQYSNSTHFLQGPDLHPGSRVAGVPKSAVLDVWQGIKNGTLTNLNPVECNDALELYYMSIYSDVVVQVDRSSSELSNMTLLNGTTIDNPDYQINLIKSIGFSSDDSWYVWHDVWSIGGNQTSAVSRSRFRSCFARQGQRQCSVILIPLVICLVLACNLLKCGAFAYLLYSDAISEPILTLGDAISSFLDRPDCSTRSKGGLCDRDILTPLSSNAADVRKAIGNRPWQKSSRRYGSAAPASRRILALELHFSYIGIMITILLDSVMRGGVDFATQWRIGLGGIYSGVFLRTQLSSQNPISVVVNALFANSPQLVLSFLYLIFNGLFTIISVSAEWSRYSQKNKRGLRVSTPAGQQRSTYWLSLPYKMSVPLLAIAGASHWLLSESISVIGVNFYSADGQRTYEEVNGVSRRSLALSVFIASQFIILLWLWGFCLFKFPSGIPVVSTNSWTISANCHPIRKGEALQKLRYGVIQDLGNDRHHVGFSSGAVRPLVAGEYYE